MLIEITSKSKTGYQLEWMASIGDFLRHLQTTDEEYIRVIRLPDAKALLRISEIEAISFVEEGPTYEILQKETNH
ncbi:hypothetical protein RM614_03420 [Mammaliicoccus sciuri]|uniref:hypothetical protein n=1 Tax=Mammaliicoccus sciuri TaxID=1296 RepID=UPI0028884376|nr:hypothetical protein [Mammaliicoccus sciuri]MDT0710175.1 hypothetical protein [Mammaliicoccus sciuri]